MSWVRLSDDWYEHPKFLLCSDSAIALWLRSLAYAQRFLTDGFVARSMLRRLTQSRTPERLAKELVGCIPRDHSAGLWVEVEDGWMIHDYLEYNASRADVTAKRKADAERQSKHRAARDSAQCHSVTNTVTHAVSPRVPSHPIPSHPDQTQIPPTPLPGGAPSAGSESEAGKQTGPAPKPRAARTVKTVLPPDWSPNPDHYAQAKREGDKDNGWVNREAQSMRDWAASKGERCADWDARFRNWIRRGLQDANNVTALPTKTRSGLLIQRDDENKSYAEAARERSRLLFADIGGGK